MEEGGHKHKDGRNLSLPQIRIHTEKVQTHPLQRTVPKFEMVRRSYAVTWEKLLSFVKFSSMSRVATVTRKKNPLGSFTERPEGLRKP